MNENKRFPLSHRHAMCHIDAKQRRPHPNNPGALSLPSCPSLGPRVSGAPSSPPRGCRPPHPSFLVRCLPRFPAPKKKARPVHYSTALQPQSHEIILREEKMPLKKIRGAARRPRALRGRGPGRGVWSRGPAPPALARPSSLPRGAAGRSVTNESAPIFFLEAHNMAIMVSPSGWI